MKIQRRDPLDPNPCRVISIRGNAITVQFENGKTFIRDKSHFKILLEDDVCTDEAEESNTKSKQHTDCDHSEDEDTSDDESSEESGEDEDLSDGDQSDDNVMDERASESTTEQS